MVNVNARMLLKWTQSSLKLWQRLISVCVIVSFLFPHLAWAFDAGTLQNGVRIGAEQKIPFELPEALGKIVAVHHGDKRWVVHIQDLHCNYEVQTHIAGILEVLARQHGLEHVGIEGAAQPLNLTKLTTFPRADVKRDVGTHFMKAGKLSGAEFYAATGGHPLNLVGIESRDHYRRARERVAAFLTSEAQGCLFDLRELLGRLKPMFYSTALARVDEQRLAFQGGRRSLSDYARYLCAQAKSRGLEDSECTLVRNYLAGSMEPWEADALYAQIDDVDRKIRDTLYTDARQRELDLYWHRLDIMEKVLNVSASGADVAEIRAEPAAFSVQAFETFLRQHWTEAEESLDPELIQLDRFLADALEFYRLADQRSLDFSDNLLRHMGRDVAAPVVLITGGFHTEAVLQQLKAAGASYVSVKPTIRHQDLVNPYFTLLRQQKTPLEKLLAQNQNIIALEPFFAEMPDVRNVITGREPEVSEQVSLGYRWMDRVLKLATIGRLLREGYTRSETLSAAYAREIASYTAGERSVIPDFSGGLVSPERTVIQFARDPFFCILAPAGISPAGQSLENVALGALDMSFFSQEQRSDVLAKIMRRPRKGVGWLAAGQRFIQALLPAARMLLDGPAGAVVNTWGGGNTLLRSRAKAAFDRFPHIERDRGILHIRPRVESTVLGLVFLGGLAVASFFLPSIGSLALAGGMSYITLHLTFGLLHTRVFVYNRELKAWQDVPATLRMRLGLARTAMQRVHLPLLAGAVGVLPFQALGLDGWGVALAWGAFSLGVVEVSVRAHQRYNRWAQEHGLPVLAIKPVAPVEKIPQTGKRPKEDTGQGRERQKDTPAETSPASTFDKSPELLVLERLLDPETRDAGVVDFGKLDAKKQNAVLRVLRQMSEPSGMAEPRQMHALDALKVLPGALMLLPGQYKSGGAMGKFEVTAIKVVTPRPVVLTLAERELLMGSEPSGRESTRVLAQPKIIVTAHPLDEQGRVNRGAVVEFLVTVRALNGRERQALRQAEVDFQRVTEATATWHGEDRTVFAALIQRLETLLTHTPEDVLLDKVFEGFYAMSHVEVLRGPPDAVFNGLAQGDAVLLDERLFSDQDVFQAGLLHELGESLLYPHTFLRGWGRRARDSVGNRLTPEQSGFVARILGDRQQNRLSEWLTQKKNTPQLEQVTSSGTLVSQEELTALLAPVEKGERPAAGELAARTPEALADTLLALPLLDRLLERKKNLSTLEKQHATLRNIIVFSHRTALAELIEVARLDRLSPQEQIAEADRLLETYGSQFGGLSGPVEKLLKQSTVGGSDFHQAVFSLGFLFQNEKSLETVITATGEMRELYAKNLQLVYLLVRTLEYFDQQQPNLLEETRDFVSLPYAFSYAKVFRDLPEVLNPTALGAPGYEDAAVLKALELGFAQIQVGDARQDSDSSQLVKAATGSGAEIRAAYLDFLALFRGRVEHAALAYQAARTSEVKTAFAERLAFLRQALNGLAFLLDTHAASMEIMAVCKSVAALMFFQEPESTLRVLAELPELPAALRAEPGRVASLFANLFLPWRENGYGVPQMTVERRKGEWSLTLASPAKAFPKTLALTADDGRELQFNWYAAAQQDAKALGGKLTRLRTEPGAIRLTLPWSEGEAVASGKMTAARGGATQRPSAFNRGIAFLRGIFSQWQDRFPDLQWQPPVRILRPLGPGVGLPVWQSPLVMMSKGKERSGSREAAALEKRLRDYAYQAKTFRRSLAPGQIFVDVEGLAAETFRLNVDEADRLLKSGDLVWQELEGSTRVRLKKMTPEALVQQEEDRRFALADELYAWMAGERVWMLALEGAAPTALKLNSEEIMLGIQEGRLSCDLSGARPVVRSVGISAEQYLAGVAKDREALAQSFLASFQVGEEHGYGWDVLNDDTALLEEHGTGMPNTIEAALGMRNGFIRFSAYDNGDVWIRLVGANAAEYLSSLSASRQVRVDALEERLQPGTTFLELESDTGLERFEGTNRPNVLEVFDALKKGILEWRLDEQTGTPWVVVVDMGTAEYMHEVIAARERAAEAYLASVAPGQIYMERSNEQERQIPDERWPSVADVERALRTGQMVYLDQDGVKRVGLLGPPQEYFNAIQKERKDAERRWINPLLDAGVMFVDVADADGRAVPTVVRPNLIEVVRQVRVGRLVPVVRPGGVSVQPVGLSPEAYAANLAQERETSAAQFRDLFVKSPLSDIQRGSIQGSFKEDGALVRAAIEPFGFANHRFESYQAIREGRMVWSYVDKVLVRHVVGRKITAFVEDMIDARQSLADDLLAFLGQHESTGLEVMEGLVRPSEDASSRVGQKPGAVKKKKDEKLSKSERERRRLLRQAEMLTPFEAYRNVVMGLMAPKYLSGNRVQMEPIDLSRQEVVLNLKKGRATAANIAIARFLESGTPAVIGGVSLTKDEAIRSLAMGALVVDPASDPVRIKMAPGILEGVFAQTLLDERAARKQTPGAEPEAGTRVTVNRAAETAARLETLAVQPTLLQFQYRTVDEILKNLRKALNQNELTIAFEGRTLEDVLATNQVQQFQTEALVITAFKIKDVKEQAYILAIADRETGEIIGHAGIHRFNETSDTGSLKFTLYPAFRQGGRGRAVADTLLKLMHEPGLLYEENMITRILFAKPADPGVAEEWPRTLAFLQTLGFEVSAGSGATFNFPKAESGKMFSVLDNLGAFLGWSVLALGYAVGFSGLNGTWLGELGLAVFGGGALLFGMRSSAGLLGQGFARLLRAHLPSERFSVNREWAERIAYQWARPVDVDTLQGIGARLAETTPEKVRLASWLLTDLRWQTEPRPLIRLGLMGLQGVNRLLRAFLLPHVLAQEHMRVRRISSAAIYLNPFLPLAYYVHQLVDPLLAWVFNLRLRFSREYREFQKKQTQTTFKPMPGARELLRALHASGVPVYIATASPTGKVWQGLRTLGLAAFISGVYGAGNNKSEVLRTVGRGVQGARTVMVGDGQYDMRSALNVPGTRAIGLSLHPRQSDLTRQGAQTVVANLRAVQWDARNRRLIVADEQSENGKRVIMENVGAVVFDYDGTLIDNQRYIRAMFGALAARFSGMKQGTRGYALALRYGEEINAETTGMPEGLRAYVRYVRLRQFRQNPEQAWRERIGRRTTVHGKAAFSPEQGSLTWSARFRQRLNRLRSAADLQNNRTAWLKYIGVAVVLGTVIFWASSALGAEAVENDNVYYSASEPEARPEIETLVIERTRGYYFKRMDPNTHQPDRKADLPSERTTEVRSTLHMREAVEATLEGNVAHAPGMPADFFITGAFNALSQGAFYKDGEIILRPAGEETGEQLRLKLVFPNTTEGMKLRVPTLLNGRIEYSLQQAEEVALNATGHLANTLVDQREYHITYDIVKTDRNASVEASQSITPDLQKEFDAIPRAVRTRLDRIKALAASLPNDADADAIKALVVMRSMRDFFAYYGRQIVELKQGTWGDFVNQVLSHNRRFLTDCDGLAINAFVYLRYLGIDTVFAMGYLNRDGNSFLTENEVHGVLVAKLNGVWQIFDPTQYVAYYLPQTQPQQKQPAREYTGVENTQVSESKRSAEWYSLPESGTLVERVDEALADERVEIGGILPEVKAWWEAHGWFWKEHYATRVAWLMEYLISLKHWTTWVPGLLLGSLALVTGLSTLGAVDGSLMTLVAKMFLGPAAFTFTYLHVRQHASRSNQAIALALSGVQLGLLFSGAGLPVIVGVGLGLHAALNWAFNRLMPESRRAGRALDRERRLPQQEGMPVSEWMPRGFDWNTPVTAPALRLLQRFRAPRLLFMVVVHAGFSLLDSLLAYRRTPHAARMPGVAVHAWQRELALRYFRRDAAESLRFLPEGGSFAHGRWLDRVLGRYRQAPGEKPRLELSEALLAALARPTSPDAAGFRARLISWRSTLALTQARQIYYYRSAEFYRQTWDARVVDAVADAWWTEGPLTLWGSVPAWMHRLAARWFGGHVYLQGVLAAVERSSAQWGESSKLAHRLRQGDAAVVIQMERLAAGISETEIREAWLALVQGPLSETAEADDRYLSEVVRRLKHLRPRDVQVGDVGSAERSLFVPAAILQSPKARGVLMDRWPGVAVTGDRLKHERPRPVRGFTGSA